MVNHRAEIWGNSDKAAMAEMGASLISLNFLVARHQMLATTDLLVTGTLWGADSTARAALESAAASHHLATAWANPDAYLAETLTERIWGLVEKRKLFSSHQDDDSVEQAEKIDDQIERYLGFGNKWNCWKNGPKTAVEVAGQRNSTNCSAALMAATPEMRHGRRTAYYRYLSGSMHGNCSMLMARAELAGDRVRFEPSNNELLLPVAVAVFGTETAAKEISKITGEALNPKPFDAMRAFVGLAQRGT